MPVIKDDEIRGYLIGEECVCRSCIRQYEEGDAMADDLILQYEVERRDLRYYCDRCSTEITPL